MARARLPALAAALAAAACASSPSTNPLMGSAAANAAINTAVAGAVAAGRRAGGDCYTPCVPGTACNAQTGMCDPLPCRGQCQKWERCDESGLVAHCVPLAPDLAIGQRAPTAVPAKAPAAAESPAPKLDAAPPADAGKR